MEPLKSNPKRQAIQTLRGYSYQIWQSVLRWIELKDEQYLFLEGAEDIDLHGPGSVETVQVKETFESGSITLRSEDVIEAMNHCWEHQINNADKNIIFRFLTTAERGYEKSNPFGGTRGLDVWESCKKPGSVCASLKTFLISIDKLSSNLRDFIKNADDEEFRQRLIIPLEWDTGNYKQDGIEREVERRVVQHGDRVENLSPWESKKVIPHLLRHAWQTACQKENRWLIRNDFLNIFQEATMMLIPKNKLKELERKASGFPKSVLDELGIGQRKIEISQPSDSIFEPLPVSEFKQFVERSKLVANLRMLLDKNKILVLSGSTGMGKSILSYQIAKSTNEEWRKISLRGNSPQEIKSLLKLTSGLIESQSKRADCIIDDLNFDKKTSVYEDALIRFMLAVKAGNGRIIITSHHSIPARVENLFGIPKDHLFIVPRLDEREIKELAAKYGCPQGRKLDSWSRIIEAHTSGHPQLVHAQIRSLQHGGWQSPKIEDIFSNEETKSVRQEFRRNLGDLLPDEARTLLYRLSIFVHRFNRRQAISISEQKPAVQNPGEYLDLLTGPWVEPIDKNHFRLSPLLGNAASEVFTPKEIKRLHSRAASSYLNETTIGFTDINSILMHGLAGNNPFPMMVLVPNVLAVEEEHKHSLFEMISWFGVVKTGENETFFTSFAVANHMLRTLQFTMLAATEPKKALPVVRNWEQEIISGNYESGIAGTKEQMMFNFLTDVILDFRVPFGLAKIANWLIELIALLNNTERFYPDHPEAETEFRNSIKNLDKPALYVRAAVTRCKTDIDVIELLSTLDKSNAAEVKIVWEILDKELDLSTLIPDKIWLDEVKKAVNDWSKCLETLTWITAVGERNKVKALVAACYRARAIIYEEYLKDSQISLQILAEGEAAVGYAHPFLQDYRSRISLFNKQYNGALKILRPLIEYYEAEKYPGRFVACRDAEICAARSGDWREAADFALKGKECFEQKWRDYSVDVTTQAADKVLIATFEADRAYAHWRAGEKEAAVNEFASLLDFFQRMPNFEDDARARMLYARICRAIAWMLNDEMKSYNDAFEPLPGWFSDFNAHEEINNEPVRPITHAWSLLASLEFKLRVGSDVFDRFEQLNKIYGDSISGFLLESMRVQHALRNLDAENIVSFFINNSNAIKENFRVSGAVDERWDDENYLKHLTFSVLVLLVGQKENPSLPLKRWRKDLSEQPDWTAAAREGIAAWFDDIEKVFLDTNTSTLKTILKNEGETFERRILAALKLSAAKILDPEIRFYANLFLLTTNFIYNWKDEIEGTVEKLIVGNWRQTAEHQKFALLMPNVTAAEILEVCQDIKIGGISKAAKVLVSANRAVNIRVSNQILETLRSLAKS